jgi:tripartite-type tricarboxylate transporter receptor subunit TctC
MIGDAMRSRRILPMIIAAVCIGLLPAELAAQPYPNRPIKLIVPFPAGGPPDTIARLVADRLSSRLGQTVVVDNRPGAGATIGTRVVVNAEPDGYTLLYGSTTSLSIGPALFKNLDYDPVKSFAPVASVSIGSMVVAINAGVPAKTLKELVAYAKANPGKLHNGAGVASPPHIAWGLFTITTETDIVFVPYRGMAQAMTDLVAGQIQMMIDGIGSLLPHIRDGKVRAVAVTGKTRSPDLPDVPTMIESGYADYLLTFWTGILAPAGTPAEIVGKLNAAINEGLKSADMKQSLAKFNVEPNIASPPEFSAFLAAEARKWADIIKATNIKVE